MSDRKIEIFKLCERLAELLGDKEAIADLKILQERRPEMFKNMQEVSHLIQKVVSEPEIIIKNPNARNKKDYIAGRKLSDEKMGEVGIRKDENISKIFHANEKRLKNLDLLAKKGSIVDGRDAHTPYTQAQSLDGRLVDDNISSTTKNIIPQSKDTLASKKQKKNKFIKNIHKTNALKGVRR